MLTLLKNIEVYAPRYLGFCDMIFAGAVIHSIAKAGSIDAELFTALNGEIIDGAGKIAFPGFIDSHVHLIGGGGEGGFSTRTPEIDFDEIVSGGVTTIVGCLGTDGTTRSLAGLLAKVRALEEQGLTAFMYTGSYQLPVKTLTDSVESDILLIDKIIGVGEIAVSDHRSSQPTYQDFLKAVASSRVGGMLSGKSGIVNVHVGAGKKGIDYIKKMYTETEIPIAQVLPTHMNRNKNLVKESAVHVCAGGYVDFTTSSSKNDFEYERLRPARILYDLFNRGITCERITFSSDAQGSLPVFNSKGNLIGMQVGSILSLFREVRYAAVELNMGWEETIPVITKNVAQVLRLEAKGTIEENNDADIVLVDKETSEITDIIAKGVVLLRNREVVKRSVFSYEEER